MGTNENWLNAGAFLREMRSEKGVSTLKVAREIGVTANYISLIERGKRQPSMSIIAALADYYTIEKTTLCGLYNVPVTSEFYNLIDNPSLKKVLNRMSTDKRLTNDDITLISEKLHELLDKDGVPK